jgi:hypothetical protein
MKRISPEIRVSVPFEALFCLILITVLCIAGSPRAAAEPSSPSEPGHGRSNPRAVPLSERTLGVGIEVDRHGARVLSFTMKPRPFFDSAEPPGVRTVGGAAPVQVEVKLRGASGPALTRRLDLPGLCLEHGPGAEPHIEGDTIRLHRESLLVELPEMQGFDTVEVAYHEPGPGAAFRRVIGSQRLDRSRFNRAASPVSYDDLVFAEVGPAGGSDTASPLEDLGIWPEEYGDPDVYRTYGDPSEADRRINIVIVPDGYTYEQKSLMEQHADSLVSSFRSKTPYAEHDPFINYTLIYAYSAQSGTDECDCGSLVDSAMGTRFPDRGYACGSSGNRCLYYGTGCDASGTTNIVAAEQRAPYHDETIVMVNTSRYGGCGGLRAVYAAGSSSATEIAIHEMGHSLAGLADEYGGSSACGTYAGEVNASLNSEVGAWAEWIDELGPPREGARYHNACIFRPDDSCEMRSLNREFCPVCQQQWALTFFGHWRVAPTAPISAQDPGPSLSVAVGAPTTFSVEGRFATGPQVTNSIQWTLQGPGYPEPTVVASGTTDYVGTFPQAGQYTLRCDVVADTNFIKPQKNGPNVGTAEWTVEATGSTSCGDGVAEGVEQCDGSDLAGASCGDQACTEGAPVCTADCVLDYGGCYGCPACDNDGVCETDEDCTNCPADCASILGPYCGNGLCEAADGEDCLSCAQDCRGKQSGRPAGRYCCGAGGGENPIPCSDARCDQGEWSCTDAPGSSTCCGDSFCTGGETTYGCEIDCGPPAVCGDGVCNADEDSCSCPADCGEQSSPSEDSCENADDDDCDGLTDCMDADCWGDLACQCEPVGSSCVSDEDCCSNKCRGKSGRKTCK